jgi:hypothetical protein
MSSKIVKSEAGKEKTTFQWFNQHPVVSTVLWVLGAEAVKDKQIVESEKNNTLSWRDDHGGSIGSVLEYVEKIQGRVENCNGDACSDDLLSLQLDKPKRFNFSDPVDSNNDLEFVDVSGDSPSPQYGFYVAITPPQPDMSLAGSIKR